MNKLTKAEEQIMKYYLLVLLFFTKIAVETGVKLK